MNNSKLHVGNLDYSVTENLLKEKFSVFGKVRSAKLATDEKGRPKGFAFVEMSSVPEAEKAIQELDGVSLQNLPMRVSAAQANTQGREFGKTGRGKRGGRNFRRR